jgi:acetyl esterase/lipase
VIRRKFQQAGNSVAEWRRLNEMVIKNQRIPKGTAIEQVRVEAPHELRAAWVRAPNAKVDRAALFLHGGGEVWPGMWHAFQVGPANYPESRQSIEQIARFVRRYLQ